MYELTVKMSFNAAHNLRNYKGKCEQIHGHNWKVEVALKGEKLDRAGMLVDFKRIKESVGEVLKKIDHRHLNKIPPFNKISPSSENIARYIYQQLKSNRLFNVKSKSCNWWLCKITVWETDTACAAYSEGSE